MLVFRHRSQFEIEFSGLLDRLKGQFAEKCLKKVQTMEGEIVALNTRRTQFRGNPGETIYFVTFAGIDCGREVLNDLRTDDSTVSYTLRGYRYDASGNDLLAKMVFDDDDEFNKPEVNADQAMQANATA